MPGPGRLGAVLIAVAVSAAMAPAAARAADETAGYLVDAQHSNAVPDSPLQPPLRMRWRADLGAVSSNVLVTGGRVLYVRHAESGLLLTALDAATGGVLWSQPVTPNFGGVGLAADAGRLFVVSAIRTSSGYDARVRALDQATGAMIWQRDIADGYGPGSRPTAEGGQLFFLASTGSTSLYALRQSDGRDLWPPKPVAGDDSAPTLDGSTVYVSGAGPHTYAFDRSTGAQRWRYDGCCTGGGGTTTRLHAGRLYAHDALVHDASNGAVVGTWNGAPAFVGDGGVEVTRYGLRGFGPGYGTTRWTIGDEYSGIKSAPLIAGSHAYISNSDNDIFAVRMSDGATVWCEHLTVPDGTFGLGIAPVAAGNGVLLVSAGYGLAAFENGGSPTSCAPTGTLPVEPSTVSATGVPVPTSGENPGVTIGVGRRTLWLGERTNVVARVAGVANAVGRTVAIELDEWPFDGRWRVAARGRVLADGLAAFKFAPRRNTAVRARLIGPEKLASPGVEVFADFPSTRREIGAAGPRPRLRYTVYAFRGAKIRRKRVVAYLVRGRTRPWRRVDVRRWQRLTSRSATVVLRFPPGRLTRRDRWLVCTREPVPDAFGRPSEIERRCGARRLPRGLS